MGLSNDAVADRWASYNEGKGYNRTSVGSGSVRFSGTDLYSYRTIIARYYNGYVLVRKNVWGISTGRHINIAMWASNWRHFQVPCVVVDDREDQIANIVALRDDLQKEIDRIIRRYRDGLWTDGIRAAHDILTGYLAATGEVNEIVEPLGDILDRVSAECTRKLAIYSDPKAVARRERAAARNMAKKLLLGEDA